MSARQSSAMRSLAADMLRRSHSRMSAQQQQHGAQQQLLAQLQVYETQEAGLRHEIAILEQSIALKLSPAAVTDVPAPAPGR